MPVWDNMPLIRLRMGVPDIVKRALLCPCRLTANACVLISDCTVCPVRPPIRWALRMVINLFLKCLFWCHRKVSDRPPPALRDEIQALRIRDAEEGHAREPLVNDNLTGDIEAESRVQELEQYVARLEKDLSKSKSYVGNLQTRLDEKETAFYRCQDAIQNKDGCIRVLENELREERDRNQTLGRELDKCRAEKEDAMTRLSQMVSVQIRDNNPNIVDLSDAWRPEKLAELSNTIYDNEWMDAVDELPEHLNDPEKIALLLDIVMRCFTFCHMLGKEQLDYVSKWIVPESDSNAKQAAQKLLKDSRRQKALEMVPIVEKDCISRLHREIDILNKDGLSSEETIEAYIKMCVKLCWLMAVQDPPCLLVCPGWKPGLSAEQTAAPHSEELMNFVTDEAPSACDDSGLPDLDSSNDVGIAGDVDGATAKEKIAFDKTVFSEYTQRGKVVEYVVWPYMLLHEGGQVLSKGVAQCCDYM